jgi:hypothetical protein
VVTGISIKAPIIVPNRQVKAAMLPLLQLQPKNPPCGGEFKGSKK